MSLLRLTIALSAGVALFAGYVAKDRLNPVAGSSQRIERDQPMDASATYAAARSLAWEAALLVQNPPHSTETWKQARSKWRQAIRLLESIPPGTPVSAAAAQRLSIYQKNYAAISGRLADEKDAQENLKAAQSLAWQASVIVQNPPHPLRVWQRANSKWQEAIALLEPIGSNTTIAPQTQAKLATYRSNQDVIDQRITVETQAKRLLERFSKTSRHLQDLSTSIVSGLTIEQIGIDYADYTALVRQMEADLNQFGQQPAGQLHPIYAPLSEAVNDYRFALKLWDTYLRYKQANSQWLYDDLFNQLVPISWLDSSTLFEKYQVKPYTNGTKVSLRFAVWEIWHHAADAVSTAQAEVDRLNRLQ
jgi:hypothetical protein